MDRIRVLFLHGIDAQPRQQWPLKCQMLASIWGVQVACPDLGSAGWMQRLWVCVGLMALALAGGVGVCVWAMMAKWMQWEVALAVCATNVIVAGAVVFCVKRYCLRCAYADALATANAEVKAFKPHVVVGQSFGAVVATALDTSLPLLLLATAHGVFCSHAGMEPPRGGSTCLLVHGTEDWMSPIEEARELNQSWKASKVDTQLLEIEGGDHQLRQLTASELCEFVHQIYAEGRDIVGPVFAEDLDPGFSDLPDEEAPLLPPPA